MRFDDLCRIAVQVRLVEQRGPEQTVQRAWDAGYKEVPPPFVYGLCDAIDWYDPMFFDDDEEQEREALAYYRVLWNRLTAEQQAAFVLERLLAAPEDRAAGKWESWDDKVREILMFVKRVKDER